MNEVIERDALPAVQAGGPVTPMRLLEIATQNGADIDKLEKLMALQERWQANEAKKAFDAAVSAAKSEIPVIVKNREVDFTSAKGRTNYMHEDFAEVARTVDPHLAKHGLSYRFRTSSQPSEPVTVTCILAHRDGHSEENSLSAGRDESGNKNSIQAIGSTITYLQRYTLKAALGLASSVDDDAKANDEPHGLSEAEYTDLENSINTAASREALEKAWAVAAGKCHEAHDPEAHGELKTLTATRMKLFPKPEKAPK